MENKRNKTVAESTMKENTSKKKREETRSVKAMSIKNMALAGMFAAFLAVISQISLPMPSGVPITIQVFGVALVGVILGWKLGVTAVVIYILIGAVGVPVFSNFRGGLSVLTGVTGGYILAWPLMSGLCGIYPKWKNKRLNFVGNILLALVGLAICECVGGLQWAVLSGTDIRWIATYSMAAFVPKDVVLVIVGVVLGRQMRRMAVKAGVLE